ncbi:MAG: hypothetical protein M0Q40_08690 [Limnochordia bacterium]|jgi:hypothetical protein|nr:hypothetical protein [Limnochordia bacterium]
MRSKNWCLSILVVMGVLLCVSAVGLANDGSQWVEIYQADEIILGPQDGLRPIEGVTAGDFRLECELRVDAGAMFTLMFRAIPNYTDGYGLNLQAKKDWSGFYRMDGAWGLRKWLEPVCPDGVPADKWLQVVVEAVGDKLSLKIADVTDLSVDVSGDGAPDEGVFFLRNVLGGMTMRNVKISVLNK